MRGTIWIATGVYAVLMVSHAEALASQAHAASSRILQQMQGMRLMYEDLEAAVSHLDSDNPDENMIDFLLADLSRHSSLSLRL